MSARDIVFNLGNDPAEGDPVVAGPVPDKLSWLRRFTRWLPGFCGYCGRCYRRCISPHLSLFFPVPKTGRACPDGHEGYVDERTIWGDTIRHRFDNVRDNAPRT